MFNMITGGVAGFNTSIRENSDLLFYQDLNIGDMFQFHKLTPSSPPCIGVKISESVYVMFNPKLGTLIMTNNNGRYTDPVTKLKLVNLEVERV